MFDGLAMLVKIRVQGGRVYGSQRYLQTEQYK
jgi:carotenoid cleavage dioxygenase-like enzyme